MSSETMNHEIMPVILSGGAGTSLWQALRQGHRKPFRPVVSNRSKLVETALRVVWPRSTASVIVSSQPIFLSENDSAYLPSGSLCQFENPGKTPLPLTDVRSGAYLGEDGVVRY